MGKIPSVNSFSLTFLVHSNWYKSSLKCQWNSFFSYEKKSQILKKLSSQSSPFYTRFVSCLTDCRLQKFHRAKERRRRRWKRRRRRRRTKKIQYIHKQRPRVSERKVASSSSLFFSPFLHSIAWIILFAPFYFFFLDSFQFTFSLSLSRCIPLPFMLRLRLCV